MMEVYLNSAFGTWRWCRRLVWPTPRKLSSTPPAGGSFSQSSGRFAAMVATSSRGESTRGETFDS